MSTGGAGSIVLDRAVAAEAFSIKRSTGNVRFDNCDAAKIFVETSTGKVSGSLPTDKVFLTHTDTGNIDVPASVTGGKCEISTNTGNIQISISH